MRYIVYGFLGSILLLMMGCVSVPKGITPITGFEPERYLGTWYEIARLDHSFERGLSKVSAEYRQNKDGGIIVINRGFDLARGTWKEATGQAYPVKSPSVGHLKVSFFWPIYSSYVISYLDEQYRYAVVTGPTLQYAWILARTSTVPDHIKTKLIQHLVQKGIPEHKLIFPTPF